MRKNLLFCFATIQILFSQFASAQLYIEETFFPVYVKKNDYRGDQGGSRLEAVPTESGLGYDFRTTLGYTFSTGIILGITYNFYNVNTSRPEVPANSIEASDLSVSKSELGPTLGYSIGTWKFLMTYFVMGEKSVTEKLTSGGSSLGNNLYTNTGINGFQLTINYGLSLGGGFEIGPSLIYRTVKYSKQSRTDYNTSSNSYPDSSMTSEPIDDELRPMVTVVYRSGSTGSGGSRR